MAKNDGPRRAFQPKGGGRIQLAKETRQCEHCFKSAREGTALSKCAGCKAVLYCSRECQKASWPTHKETCRKNQRVAAELKTMDVDPLTPLNAFVEKHIAAISRYGLCAFNLADPARYMSEVLVFAFRRWPGSHPVQSSYILLDVNFSSLEMFGSRAGEVRQWMAEHQAHFIKTGHIGGIWLVMADAESTAKEFCPVGYENKDMRDPMWKEKLFLLVNSGTRL
ncbi:hypothetical protein D9619_010099 [Psilocybe cf. subviscida]|uniref:MYND-type domain-containing protein n=1 Tax=Psilocybe cf. subviscida TaxID=2480587 RepID=A0A8H5BKM3_9AGAR|nr:hypothetical protein D9619_010099 [Psilocybe cf. subviscida]